MVLLKLNAHTQAEINQFYNISKSNNSRFFLKVGVDGKPTLDVTHAYYYQVQAQLKFWVLTIVTLYIVWQEGKLFVQRTYPDDTFMASALEKRWLLQFYL